LFSFASSFFNSYCTILREQLGGAITELLEEVGDPNSQALFAWDPTKIITILSTHRDALNKSIPFEGLREQVLREATGYIAGRLLNALLENGNEDKKMKLCRCAHGVGMKMVIVQVEEWVEMTTWPSALALCKQNLAVARHAADVLVVNKSSLVQTSVRDDVCPSLSIQQLVCLLESYSPDELDPEPVHPGVIASIRNSNTAASITTATPQHQKNLLIDLSTGELQTHFMSTGAVCDLASTPIPANVISRPGFAFLRTVCTDNTPW